MTKKLSVLVFVFFVLIILGITYSFNLPRFTSSSDHYYIDIFSSCQDKYGLENKKCYSDVLLKEGAKNPSGIKSMLSFLEKGLKNPSLNVSPFLHPDVHDLGMILYQQLKDPFLAYSYCGSEFRSGCQHSVIMSYFDDITTPENFKFQDAILFCSTLKERLSLSRSDFTSCIHGIGHISISKFKGDLLSALKGCELAPSTTIHTCYDGIFMEYSKGETSIGIHSENPSGTIFLPCDTLPYFYASICYDTFGRTSPAFVNRLRDTESFKEAAELCQNVQEKYRFFCMLGVTRALLYANVNDIYASNKVCKKMGHLQPSCKEALIINTVYGLEAPAEKRLTFFCAKYFKPFKTHCVNTIRAYYDFILEY